MYKSNTCCERKTALSKNVANSVFFFSFKIGSGNRPNSQLKQVYIFPEWKLKIPNGRFIILFSDLIILFISSTIVNIIVKTLLFSILTHFLAKQQHYFPNFNQNATNFPNPKWPGSIPKMVQISSLATQSENLQLKQAFNVWYIGRMLE